MDNDQVATDTAALQSYIDRVKALSKEMDTAELRMLRGTPTTWMT
jgi:hypothetical protein